MHPCQQLACVQHASLCCAEAASCADAQAQLGGDERLLATATGIFKKLGALRAL